MRETETLVTLKTLTGNKNKTVVITTNEKQTKTHETEKKVVAKTTEIQTEKRVKNEQQNRFQGFKKQK